MRVRHSNSSFHSRVSSPRRFSCHSFHNAHAKRIDVESQGHSITSQVLGRLPLECTALPLVQVYFRDVQNIVLSELRDLGAPISTNEEVGALEVVYDDVELVEVLDAESDFVELLPRLAPIRFLSKELQKRGTWNVLVHEEPVVSVTSAKESQHVLVVELRLDAQLVCKHLGAHRLSIFVVSETLDQHGVRSHVPWKTSLNALPKPILPSGLDFTSYTGIYHCKST